MLIAQIQDEQNSLPSTQRADRSHTRGHLGRKSDIHVEVPHGQCP
jgi:hypothetical protein